MPECGKPHETNSSTANMNTPDGGSQFADFTQHMGVYVVELSGAVPLHGAAGNRVGAAVGK